MSKVTSLQTYDEPIRVNKRIYKISNEYIVKLISSKSLLAKEDIFYEIKIARISHSMGIPVAEPIICDYVKIYGKIQMGFIMEYVAGIEGSNEEYNKFKHPSPIVLNRLACSGSSIRRTDENGAIWIHSDGESIMEINWR